MKHLVRTALLLGAALLAHQAAAATCKIEEFRSLATDSSGKELQVAMQPRVDAQQVTYTTATASAAFNTATRFVRVICDAKAHYRFSVAGTDAAATDPYIPADTPEYFGVQAGLDLVVSFYDGAT